MSSAPSPVRRVLLVGWDAADWRVIHPLLDAGQMPALARLVENGVMGNLATLYPAISPMLWNSIATGKTADKHGILGFNEADPQLGIRPAASTSRRCKALWNILQQALGWRCHVVGWWASHPAEPLDGAVVTDYFRSTQRVGPSRWRVPPHAVHPPELATDLAPLRMDINEVSEEMVLPFIPRAAEIDQQADRGLEVFAGLLSEAVTIQAAATAVMEARDWEFAAVYFDAIDHFSHAFMPYHPPRQAHVPEATFEMYRGVVDGIYRLQDMMLARLIELAGPDALVVVCSDHGFQSGDMRPLFSPEDPAGPILWHRDHGMLVMSGPNIRRDERIHGATLLDVAPTILTACGLPVGRDMDGKVLGEAFEQFSPPAPIDSWDAVPGRAGMLPPDFEWERAPDAAREIMAQFAALGYVEESDQDLAEKGVAVTDENDFNLVQVFLSKGQPDRAVEVMERLVQARPWESRYLHQLANAYGKAGWHRAAEDMLRRAYPTGPQEEEAPLVALVLLARARLGRGDRPGATAVLQHAMRRMLRHPPIWVEIGALWLELQELAAAEACFRHAAELDPDNAPAWQGLSSVALRRRDNLAAIDAGLTAVRLVFQLPITHCNLGIAFAREGRVAEAVVALRRAVAMQPGMLLAHRWLAALRSEAGGNDGFLASAHQAEAVRLSRERALAAAPRQRRAEEARPLPEIPPPAERLRRARIARPAAFEGKVPPSGRRFTLVSGLPRSGTSLMMQMLAAGGLPAHTDALRTADEDNPEGYLEWEAVKRIAREPELLDEPGLEHRAIKVISALLPALPRHHRYGVIFMRRPAEEIVRSQAQMIARRGAAPAATDAVHLEAHAVALQEFLRGHPNVFDVLEVDYPSLVAEPASWVPRIVEFVGAELLPDAAQMARAVRASLYRNRAEPPAAEPSPSAATSGGT